MMTEIIRCWRVRRWLKRASLEDLSHVPSWVKTHLDFCMGCEDFHHLWLNWEKDLRKSFRQLTEEISVNKAFSLSLTEITNAGSLNHLQLIQRKRGYLQPLRDRLWWILAPEITLKWVVVAMVFIFVGGVTLTKRYDSYPYQLPYRLVLVGEETLMTNFPGKGIKFISGAYPYHPEEVSGDSNYKMGNPSQRYETGENGRSYGSESY
ncbi:MAG: hypothetical protein ACK4OO_03495 [bacterium]